MIIYSCFGIQHRSVIQICLQWYQLEGAVWMSECVCVCVYAFNGSDQFCSTLADSQQVHTHTRARAHTLAHSQLQTFPAFLCSNQQHWGFGTARADSPLEVSGFLDMDLWKCNLSRTGFGEVLIHLGTWTRVFRNGSLLTVFSIAPQSSCFIWITVIFLSDLNGKRPPGVHNRGIVLRVWEWNNWDIVALMDTVILLQPVTFWNVWNPLKWTRRTAQ